MKRAHTLNMSTLRIASPDGYVRASDTELTRFDELAIDDDAAVRIDERNAFRAAKRGNEDAVLGLLQRGDHTIDAQDSFGDTVLHHAARGNHGDLVSALLAQRKPPPNINLRNAAYMTVRCTCVSCCSGTCLC
jgi:hypothetical protein